jgi:hypothetical protein
MKIARRFNCGEALNKSIESPEGREYIPSETSKPEGRMKIARRFNGGGKH